MSEMYLTTIKTMLFTLCAYSKGPIRFIKRSRSYSNTAFYSCNHFSATCFSDMHERTAGRRPASAEPMWSLLCVHRCVVTPDRVANGLFKNKLVWERKGYSRTAHPNKLNQMGFEVQ